MNRRGFFKAAAFIPAVFVPAKFKAATFDQPAATGVLEVENKNVWGYYIWQRDDPAPGSITWIDAEYLDTDAALRDMLPQVGVPKAWLKP